MRDFTPKDVFLFATGNVPGPLVAKAICSAIFLDSKLQDAFDELREKGLAKESAIEEYVSYCELQNDLRQMLPKSKLEGLFGDSLPKPVDTPKDRASKLRLRGIVSVLATAAKTSVEEKNSADENPNAFIENDGIFLRFKLPLDELGPFDEAVDCIKASVGQVDIIIPAALESGMICGEIPFADVNYEEADGFQRNWKYFFEITQRSDMRK